MNDSRVTAKLSQAMLDELRERLTYDEELQTLLGVASTQATITEPHVLHSSLKYLNYGCALGMSTAAILRLTCYDSAVIFMDGFYLAFTVYLLLFAGLLAASEYQVQVIIRYVAFLLSSTGKGLFLLFIGLLLFDQKRIPDLVVSLITSLVGIVNIAVSFIREKPQKEDPEPDTPNVKRSISM